MCRAWGINRNTLRSAIARLQASGLLLTVQGSGTRVVHRFCVSLDNLRSFSEAATACDFHPETKFLSCVLIDCDQQLSHIFHCSIGEPFCKVSCLRLLDKNPVMINTAYFPVDPTVGLTEQDLENSSFFQMLEDSCHLNHEYGTSKISLTHVSAEEARFLNLSAGASAFQLATQINTPEGKPIEYCRTVARADKIDLVSSMHWEVDKENIT